MTLFNARQQVFHSFPHDALPISPGSSGSAAAIAPSRSARSSTSHSEDQRHSPSTRTGACTSDSPRSRASNRATSAWRGGDRKSTRLNSSHPSTSYAAFCLKKKNSSVRTTLPTAYDVYPLACLHAAGYYTVNDSVTIDLLSRTAGNNVSVGFIVWLNFTATK